MYGNFKQAFLIYPLLKLITESVGCWWDRRRRGMFFNFSEIPFLRVVGLSFVCLLFPQSLYRHSTCKVQNHIAELVWMLVCSAPCTSRCYDVFHRTLAERQISYPSPKPLKKRFARNWIRKITEIRLSASLRCRWKWCLITRQSAENVKDIMSSETLRRVDG